MLVTFLVLITLFPQLEGCWRQEHVQILVDTLNCWCDNRPTDPPPTIPWHVKRRVEEALAREARENVAQANQAQYKQTQEKVARAKQARAKLYKKRFGCGTCNFDEAGEKRNCDSPSFYGDNVKCSAEETWCVVRVTGERRTENGEPVFQRYCAKDDYVDFIKRQQKEQKDVWVVESHNNMTGNLNYCKDPSELVKRYNRKSRSMFEVENVDEVTWYCICKEMNCNTQNPDDVRLPKELFFGNQWRNYIGEKFGQKIQDEEIEYDEGSQTSTSQQVNLTPSSCATIVALILLLP